MDDDLVQSWPQTPDSPTAGSLYHATTTIDDLTVALINYSRIPSPEPTPRLTCCCGKEVCENTKGWLAFKSKLESRLILSAEVGQALLQRHEAYVRRHNPGHRSQDTQAEVPADYIDTRVAELIKENAVLEKRLNQALLEHEVKDSSHKTVLQKLEEAQASVSRLTAHHARAVGLDTRLTAVTREKEDLQQERDSEAQRAKVAETRIAALQERTTKLQTEVRRLQKDLEQRRQHRLELSEEILHEARSRLETLQNYQLGHNAITEENEVTKVLESLVADNENLKHDNAELQNLLTEAREDVHTLQEELEENRAALLSGSRVGTPQSKQIYIGSTSSSLKEQSMQFSGRRTASVEPKSRRVFEPPTPETHLLPVHSLLPLDAKHTPFIHPRPRYPPSHVSLEIDDDRQHHNASLSPRVGTPHRSLLLLSQSRGVQTDDWLGILPRSYGEHMSNSSPLDGRSESSSMMDTHCSHLAIVLERVITLLNRMTQADALTLTNRLKRQNLKGADVGHLSRTTVTGILSEATQLRGQFRAILEDDKMPTTCTRKDLRGLFKLFKEMFEELAQMRITLNDIILDPSIAERVSETALNPTKAAERERLAAKSSSWMLPLTKLFGSSETNTTINSATSPIRAVSRGRDTARAPARIVPKLRPALAASATTVNVEFSGNGRSITSTSSAQAIRQDEVTNRVVSSASPAPTQESLMGIFAGAPLAAPADPWIVLPKSSRKPFPPTLNGDLSGTATIGRSTLKSARSTTHLSQNVDAVIDFHSPIKDDENDALAPLLQRTLRRRGLSDSSIHSAFITQSEESPSLSHAETEAWPETAGVLRALSRRVQSFRLAATHTLSSASPVGSTSDPETPATGASPPRVSTVPGRTVGNTDELPSPPPHAPRASSPISALLPNLSSWTAAGAVFEPGGSTSEYFTGSPREDLLHRPWLRETHGRDF